MPEDNVKRNKRIAAWQKGKRVAVLLRDKPAVDAAADRAGQSVNAWINDAISDKLDRRETGH